MSRQKRENLLELERSLHNLKSVARFLLIDYEYSNSSSVEMFQWDDNYVNDLNKICVEFIDKVHRLNNDYCND